MNIVRLVTRVACARKHDLRDVSRAVAGMAVEPAVCAGQRVFCLVIMVKAPTSPTVRVVAESTIISQPALVVLVLVTLLTDGGCILV